MSHIETCIFEDKINKKIMKIAEAYGYKSQSIIMIEEMSELTKAICKIDRLEERADHLPMNADDYEKAVKSLKEEIADVYIMLSQMQYHMDISNKELKKRMNKKLDRQIKRMEE